MIKTYQIRDMFTTKKAIRFDAGFAVFEDKNKNGLLQYTTGNKDMQDDIENSAFYDNGTITLRESIQSTSEMRATDERKTQVHVNEPNNVAIFPDVTTFKAAREILGADPYNVSQSSLRNSTAVFDKAQELGISFPNLTAQ